MSENHRYSDDRNLQHDPEFDTAHDTRTPPIPDNHHPELPWEQEIHEDAAPLPERMQAQNTAGEGHLYQYLGMI